MNYLTLKIFAVFNAGLVIALTLIAWNDSIPAAIAGAMVLGMLLQIFDILRPRRRESSGAGAEPAAP